MSEKKLALVFFFADLHSYSFWNSFMALDRCVICDETNLILHSLGFFCSVQCSFLKSCRVYFSSNLCDWMYVLFLDKCRKYIVNYIVSVCQLLAHTNWTENKLYNNNIQEKNTTFYMLIMKCKSYLF